MNKILGILLVAAALLAVNLHADPIRLTPTQSSVQAFTGTASLEQAQAAIGLMLNGSGVHAITVPAVIQLVDDTGQTITIDPTKVLTFNIAQAQRVNPAQRTGTGSGVVTTPSATIIYYRVSGTKSQ